MLSPILERCLHLLALDFLRKLYFCVERLLKKGRSTVPQRFWVVLVVIYLFFVIARKSLIRFSTCIVASIMTILVQALLEPISWITLQCQVFYSARLANSLGRIWILLRSPLCNVFCALPKPCCMALGALSIKARLEFTDAELVEQINENPYL